MEIDILNLSYNTATFTVEGIIIDCLEQVIDRQPDPYLWLERARTAVDVWWELVTAGGVEENDLEAIHQRFTRLITRAEAGLKKG